MTLDELKKEFKIGDSVQIVHKNIHPPFGAKGIVRALTKGLVGIDNGSYEGGILGIEFIEPKDFVGHDLQGTLRGDKKFKGYWVAPVAVKKISGISSKNIRRMNWSKE